MRFSHGSSQRYISNEPHNGAGGNERPWLGPFLWAPWGGSRCSPSLSESSVLSAAVRKIEARQAKAKSSKVVVKA